MQKVIYVPTDQPAPSAPHQQPQQRSRLPFTSSDERAFIQAQREQPLPAEQSAAGQTDRVHTVAALTGLLLMTAGAGLVGGTGYAALMCGVVLLAGVIYARTGALLPSERDEP